MRPAARTTAADGWRSLEDAAAAMRRIDLTLDHADVLRRGTHRVATDTASAHPAVRAAREYLRTSARDTYGRAFGPYLMGNGAHAQLAHAIASVARRASRTHFDAHPDAAWFGTSVCAGVVPPF